MYFTQGEILSSYPTTALNYFGQPSGGLRFFRDFLMADCQSPRIFRRSGFGPVLALGLAGFGFDLRFILTLRNFHRICFARKLACRKPCKSGLALRLTFDFREALFLLSF
jgi:hypothetical protein